MEVAIIKVVCLQTSLVGTVKYYRSANLTALDNAESGSGFLNVSSTLVFLVISRAMKYDDRCTDHRLSRVEKIKTIGSFRLHQ